MEEYNALTEAIGDPGVSTFKSGCPEQRRDDVGRNRPDEHALAHIRLFVARTSEVITGQRHKVQ